MSAEYWLQLVHHLSPEDYWSGQIYVTVGDGPRRAVEGKFSAPTEEAAMEFAKTHALLHRDGPLDDLIPIELPARV